MTGPSSAVTTPPSREIAYTAGRPPADVAAMAASAAASPACATWVPISSGRAGNRSASAPPHEVSRSTGSAWRSTAKPMRAADPVCWRTYQLTPSTCIQVPATETNPAPAQIR
jgi:hypothetical protein